MKTPLCFYLLIAALFCSVIELPAQSGHHKKKKHRSASHRTGDPVPGKTYEYTVESNEPENAPNLSLRVAPVYADIYGLNYSLGYDASLSYRFDNRIELGGFYRGSYLDRFLKADGNSGQIHGVAVDQNTPVSNYGASFSWFFKNETVVKNEDVVLKMHDNGAVKTIYVLRIPAHIVQLWGIEATYERFNSSIYSLNGNIRYHNQPPSPSTFDLFDDGAFSTYMRSGIVAVGVSRTVISDIHINVEKFGKKKTTYVSRLYADFIYATDIRLSDILITNPISGGTTAGTVNAYTSKNPIGFRVGYMTYVNDKFSALGGYGIEMGVRPGPRAGFDSFYLLVKYSMTLSVRTHKATTDSEE